MRYYFRPKPNITTRELAYIVSHIVVGSKAIFLGIEIEDDQWKKIPDHVKRHFTLDKNEDEDNSF